MIPLKQQPSKIHSGRVPAAERVQPVLPARRNTALKSHIYDSICRLTKWLERNDYRGYDTFDGLNARFLRPLTFESKFLRTLLQQGVRRFPLNIRPLVGVAKYHSTKAMGFLTK